MSQSLTADQLHDARKLNAAMRMELRREVRTLRRVGGSFENRRILNGRIAELRKEDRMMADELRRRKCDAEPT